MISTMEADFQRLDPPPSLQALEDYAEGTSSQLLYLQARACMLLWGRMQKACMRQVQIPCALAAKQAALPEVHEGCCCGMQGRVAGVDSQHYDHAASHLGKAVGIANLLRGTAYHTARSLIPSCPLQLLIVAPGLASVLATPSSVHTLPLPCLI